jgi:hypothetical protein
MSLKKQQPFSLEPEVLANLLTFVSDIERGKAFIYSVKGSKHVKTKCMEEINAFNDSSVYKEGGALYGNDNTLNPANSGKHVSHFF